MSQPRRAPAQTLAVALAQAAFWTAFWLAAPAAAQSAAPLPASQIKAPPMVMLNPAMDNGTPIDSGGAIARVSGLKAGGDGFLSVREAPSVKAAERGRLGPGRLVIATHPEHNDDTFVGIIYDDVPENASGPFLAERCRVSEATPTEKPYRRAYLGPCKTGWVARRFIEVLAD
ncbi:hypothetical protein [Xanthobacter sediminis]|uniref:hypothetical protein n=1 Tax=Xanthobacter sediminis TaxID=3119926 RepID=UPI003728DD7A